MLQETVRPSNIVSTINRVSLNRLLPAGLWLLFANNIAKSFLTHLANQNWLLAARDAGSLTFTLLIVALFMFRHSVRGPRAKPVEAIAAIAGTFAPSFIATREVTTTSDTVLLASSIIGFAGMIWAIVSLATLGRCFGIFPEARGLVTHGPYRLVRHPLYLGEIIMFIGIQLPALTLVNIVIFIVAVGLQIWRAINEERALGLVFPEYADYKARTKRLIPFIW